jgi:NAD(P)-dependent dehydrogenase (short-subunit alcohol dehydrogenase family)
MLNRFTLSAAAECEGQGVAVNALAPQAVISTPALIELNMIDPDFYEPMEATSEAGLVLCTCDPAKLHGRIAFTIQLLMELERPVYDLHGEELFGGWQPADLRKHLETQLAAHERTGLRNAYAYNRPSSPCP